MTSNATTQTEALLLTETKDGIATLTLNRPGQLVPTANPKLRINARSPSRWRENRVIRPGKEFSSTTVFAFGAKQATGSPADQVPG